MDKLTDLITADYAVLWIVMLLLVLAAVYKWVPPIYYNVKGAGKKEAEAESAHKSLDQRVEALETQVEDINQKLDRDFSRLNEIADSLRQQQKVSVESLEERELIIKSLLAMLKGLQEIGANGPTKVAQAEIETYLNKQAHEPKHTV